ncbi:5534_t:CDS:2 [Ambispora gerdemannii]|uniref:5534_t:CDS:1 n=1 Tax=Ambispora gerdemannii TaxID=144530 RepID=A0A9N9BIQ0_9GLOM|nr:5534_t:CDS:2 [Ambispora gerdemannii]
MSLQKTLRLILWISLAIILSILSECFIVAAADRDINNNGNTLSVLSSIPSTPTVTAAATTTTTGKSNPSTAKTTVSAKNKPSTTIATISSANTATISSANTASISTTITSSENAITTQATESQISSQEEHVPRIGPIIAASSVAFLVLVILVATIFMTKRSAQTVDDSANKA